MGIFPRGLPQLSKQLRDQKTTENDKVSQQRALTEGGLDSMWGFAAILCFDSLIRFLDWILCFDSLLRFDVVSMGDFLNRFRKSPDVYSV